MSEAKTDEQTEALKPIANALHPNAARLKRVLDNRRHMHRGLARLSKARVEELLGGLIESRVYQAHARWYVPRYRAKRTRPCAMR